MYSYPRDRRRGASNESSPNELCRIPQTPQTIQHCRIPETPQTALSYRGVQGGPQFGPPLRREFFQPGHASNNIDYHNIRLYIKIIY